MSTKLLTNLLFEPKGVHDPALTYSIKDTVMSPDGSKVYFALRDVPSGIALTDEDYWMLQIDLSGSKNAMDEAVAAFADYAKIVGTRVKGETAKATGNPVSFLPDAGSLLQPVTVLDVQQQGSGDPSPSNIRPITGYDKLNLNHAGKNLLPNASAGTKTVNGITLTSNGDGSYNLKGAASSGASIYFALENSVTIPGGAYWHLLNEGITGSAAFTPKFSDGTTGSIAFSIANRVGAIAENLTGKTITEFGVYVQGGTTLDITFKPMLCLSDAPSDFVPYQGKLHTVQIGQTVYGGKLDWLTGKLVAEYAMKQIKIDGAWDINLELEGFTRATQSGAVDLQGVYTYGSKDGAFSHGKYLQNWGDASIHAYVNSYTFVMTLPTTLVGNTSESVNAWLSAQDAAGTPVQITYKLATPIEIQLTPHIISAVDPEQTNTLYGDGSIEVEYVKPLHVSIEERVAAALAAATE